MSHNPLRLLILPLAALVATGCSELKRKRFQCTTALVLAYPAKGDTASLPGAPLFQTSVEALPQPLLRLDPDVTRLDWRGLRLVSETNDYSVLTFTVYSLQDHFHRMHANLMNEKTAREIHRALARGPADFEPIWDIRPHRAPKQEEDEKPKADPQSDIWPTFEDPTWYQGEDFSQIARARKTVEAHLLGNAQPRVRVAHLDTGYTRSHAAFPTNVNLCLSKDFTSADSLFGKPADGAEDVPENSNALLHAYGHGTGTLTVLASGTNVAYAVKGKPRRSETLGVVPFAEVICVRARPTFMHFFPVRLARGIMHCVSNHVDVVSMSQGGTPSLALTAAVNEAYQRGTVLVAASSDFVRIFRALPFVDMAYPALYPRVLAAPGITGDYRSYGDTPVWAVPRYLLRPWRYCSDFGALIVRGSYGPKERMDNAVSAFSPNIPFAEPKHPLLVDLDGGGTSSSTPQVAGAAALWVQRHMTELEATKRRWTWEKVEMTMQALLRTASSRHIPEGEMKLKYGRGYLRAADALAREPRGLLPVIEQKKPESYPVYKELSAVFTTLYLQSLTPEQGKRVAAVFPPGDHELLERYVGAYMRQTLVLQEMFFPGKREAHQRWERNVAELRRHANGPNAGSYRREMAALAGNLREILSPAVGKMGVWKRERRPLDWLVKWLTPSVSEFSVLRALEKTIRRTPQEPNPYATYFMGP